MSENSFDSKKLRKTILDMAYVGSSAHIGCAFSIVELLAVLYRDFLRYPGNDPLSDERDYLVLSKGHGVMAQYACMREKNWLTDDQFKNYFSDGTELNGLADSRVSGIETTTGSLGHGFSVGVGLAFGAKLKSSNQKTYVLVGDGELNEGPIWEGALFASHHSLKNLFLIVDRNGFQAMGRTQDILDLEELPDKLKSFGFETIVVDGHNENEIKKSFIKLLSSNSDSPKALIARTVKGKGVPFMEDQNRWHYTRLDHDSYARATLALDGFN